MLENRMRVTVIGGGPGGYVAAIRAAQLGAAVTLIEKGTLGGTCLNIGCIPTKALLHTAFLYEDILNADRWGITASAALDFPAVQAGKRRIVERLVDGVRMLMKANGITVVEGEASFVSQKSLVVKNGAASSAVDFDRAIIATGSEPVVPPIPGIDLPCCIDSTGALALENVPNTLAVIGGGVIGIEIAAIYASFGTKVTVIEMMDEILPHMDAELAKNLRHDMARKGVAFFLKAKVLAVAGKDGAASLRVLTEKGEETLAADKVLVAVGRKPRADVLRMESIGVVLDGNRIIVNDRMETRVPGVYAVGDCTGGLLLAHVASAQGEVAAENALGSDAKFSARTTPFCVYARPELAGVGLTETQATEMNIAHAVGRFPLAANGKALIEGDTSGLVKIISGKPYGEILGVHILGPHATDLIAEAALSIGTEATLDEIIATIHAHPTLAEAIREAALAVENRAIHILPGSGRIKKPVPQG